MCNRQSRITVRKAIAISSYYKEALKGQWAKTVPKYVKDVEIYIQVTPAASKQFANAEKLITLKKVAVNHPCGLKKDHEIDQVTAPMLLATSPELVATKTTHNNA